MAQGAIKSKLGSTKGKKPAVLAAKKGKRTIAPKKTALVKNARMIKVCNTMSFTVFTPAYVRVFSETLCWAHLHDGEDTGRQSWPSRAAKGRKEEQGLNGPSTKGRIEEVWLSGPFAIAGMCRHTQTRSKSGENEQDCRYNCDHSFKKEASRRGDRRRATKVYISFTFRVPAHSYMHSVWGVC